MGDIRRSLGYRGSHVSLTLKTSYPVVEAMTRERIERALHLRSNGDTGKDYTRSGILCLDKNVQELVIYK